MNQGERSQCNGEIRCESPINIKGGSRRISALTEGLRRNVTYVSSCCQMLQEHLLVHTLFPVDNAEI